MIALIFDMNFLCGILADVLSKILIHKIYSIEIYHFDFKNNCYGIIIYR